VVAGRVGAVTARTASRSSATAGSRRPAGAGAREGTVLVPTDFTTEVPSIQHLTSLRPQGDFLGRRGIAGDGIITPRRRRTRPSSPPRRP
jgi:hypothetical protein